MNSPNPRLQYVQVRAPGPFTKALAVIAGAGLLVVGLMIAADLMVMARREALDPPGG